MLVKYSCQTCKHFELTSNKKTIMRIDYCEIDKKRIKLVNNDYSYNSNTYYNVY